MFSFILRITHKSKFFHSSHDLYFIETLSKNFFSLIGWLTKERLDGAQRAKTYFTKVVIDPQWDAATLALFSKKLAAYNISIEAYQNSFKIEAVGTITEPEEEDDSMDVSPSGEDVSRSSPIPALPPRIAVQTTASSNITHSFSTPPLPPRSKQLQRAQTQSVGTSSTAKSPTPQNVKHSAVVQPKKKNRIESIQKPTTTFRSPRRDIVQSPSKDSVQSSRRHLLFSQEY